MSSRLSLTQKSKVIKLIEEGLSQSKISVKLGISLQQVKYVAKKLKDLSVEEQIELSVVKLLNSSKSAIPFQQILEHIKRLDLNANQEFDSLWLKKLVNKAPELKAKTVRIVLIS